MLGEKLLDLRKSKGLSQEEVADKLGVTRQTVSKWETDQSTPDFDKIAPLCKLYDISADELLTGVVIDKEEKVEIPNNSNNKKIFGVCLGIFLYFVAVAWIMTSIPVLSINPVLASAIFILIIGIATITIIYYCSVYKEKKCKCDCNSSCDKEDNTVEKQVIHITAILFTIIYLYISFTTGKWNITWIIWIIYALTESIIKLLFSLRGDK